MSTDPELEPDMLDPDGSNFVAIFGMKGSGKSVRARHFFEHWQGPAMVIDAIGDVDVRGLDGRPVKRTTEPPTRWPRREVNGREELEPRIWYTPDVKDNAWLEKVDVAIGLANRTPHCLLWLDEVHLLLPVHTTRRMPGARSALIVGRHTPLSILACGPRPSEIDLLVLQQADHVLVYDLPNADDRERIAKTAGWERHDFHARHGALGRHEYLWLNRAEKRLSHYDPVDPLDRPRPRPQRD